MILTESSLTNLSFNKGGAMSDVLSQKEIDQLLLDFSKGNLDTARSTDAKQPAGPAVRAFDFRTANRVPRDQVKTLTLIYENFTRQLSTFLTATLGVGCEASLASVEEQSFQEFANDIFPGCLLAILKMPPLQGPVLFRLAPDVGYAMVECLFGGDAQPHDFRRNFTEIDLAILEKIIRQILLQVDESWERVAKVRTVLESIETSIQFARIVPLGDAMVIITIHLRIGATRSFINFCIPQNALEPVAKNLNNRLAATGISEKKPVETYHEVILDRLRASKIPLKAILSETTIRISDLINLQVGDVIQLDNRMDQPIKIKVGHIPRLTGVLGHRNRHYAVKITGLNFEEDQEHV